MLNFTSARLLYTFEYLSWSQIYFTSWKLIVYYHQKGEVNIDLVVIVLWLLPKALVHIFALVFEASNLSLHVL